jgi:hypothetical protein
MTSSCKKVPTTTTTNNSLDTISVGFHFHTFIGGNLVDPVDYVYQAFQDSSTPPRTLHLSAAQFYFSNIAIHLVDSNRWIPLTNLVVIKRISNEIYPIGRIPSDVMDSVRFTVGIGNGLNSQMPSSFSTTSPFDSVLSSTEQAPMWGSGMAGMNGMASGYTFMNIIGYDSTNSLPFSYQIGGYGDTVNVVLSYSTGFNFVPILGGGELNLFHIVADYGKLLQVLNPLTPTNTNSTFYGPAPAASNTLLNNIKNMFRWECSPPINC